MTRTNEIKLTHLRNVLDDLGMSFTVLSKETGIGYKTLYMWFNESSKPTRTTVKKLVDYLNTPAIQSRLNRLDLYRVSDFTQEG